MVVIVIQIIHLTLVADLVLVLESWILTGFCAVVPHAHFHSLALFAMQVVYSLGGGGKQRQVSCEGVFE